MRKLGESFKHSAPNAWGRDLETTRQRFEVEPSDVAQGRDNYLGHGKPGRTFKSSDIGREIEVIRSPGYESWYFIN